MAELTDWVGRVREQEDEIGRPALRRIAAMLDIGGLDLAPGAAVPTHWYAMFFPEIAAQAELGEDGHPRRGDFLPPVALPRRMFAGRRVWFDGALRVGDLAVKRSEVVAVTPKRGRSGEMVFVTVAHRVSVGGRVVVREEQDVVYRAAAVPGAAAGVPMAAPPADWSQALRPTTTLLFRYSAVTWNGHRIHYDADYARGVEGYPGLVMNGGLSLLLLMQAVSARLGQAPTAVAVRNLMPVLVDTELRLEGTEVADGRARAWVRDARGGLAVMAELEF